MRIGIVAFSLATLSAAALFSTAPESENSQSPLALFGLHLPAASSASLQCVGDCQVNGPSVAPQEASDNDGNIVSAMIRNFMQPDVTIASAAGANHIVIDATPVIEMLYNYLNLADGVAQPEKHDEAPLSSLAEAQAAPTTDAPLSSRDGEADAVSSTDRPLNRLIAHFFGSEISAESTNVASITPAAASITMANESANQMVDIQLETNAAKDEENESGFDVNSWGDRMESAAKRVAANFEGVAIHFFPGSPQSTSASAADVSGVGSLVAEPVSVVEAEATSSSLTHWFRF